MAEPSVTPAPGRRVVRDLVALAALPAAWAGCDECRIAETLADALLATLDLDFVYLRLHAAAGAGELQVARSVRGGVTDDRVRQIGQSLAPFAGLPGPAAQQSIPNPLGAGTTNVAGVPLGWESGEGVLVAGSRHPSFPSPEDVLLLRVGANQAAMALQRNRAEAARRASEERFRRYFDLGLIGIVITSPTKDYLEVNDELCRILGYEREELLQKTWPEMTHPDDLAADLARFQRVRAGEIDGYTMDKRWVRKDGRVVHSTISVKCARLADGSVDYFVALLEDVTERRRAEEALRESEARLDLAMRGSGIGIWDLDLAPGGDYRRDPVRFVNIWEPLGYDPAEFPADAVASRSLGHPDDLLRVDAAVAACLAGETEEIRVENRIRHKDGSWHWLLTLGKAIREESGKPVRLIGTVLDITERKRAEEALRASEERMAADLAAMTRLQKVSTRLVRDGDPHPLLLEIVDAAIAITAADMGNIQLYDPASDTLRIVAARGFRLEDLRTFGGIRRGQSTCGTALARGERVVVGDVTTSPIFVGKPILGAMLGAGIRAAQSTPLVGRSGRLVGMLSTHYRTPRHPAERDLHVLDLLARQAADWIERSEADESLRESEGRFRGTFENAAVGIAHMDAETRYLRVNQKFCDILGYERDELLGGLCLGIMYADDLAVGADQFASLMRGELPSFSAEKRFLRKDGSTVWVDMVVSLQRDAEGKPAYAIEVVADVSERRRLEEVLRQAKDTAEATNRAKDEFLANVSHEIRTPFSAILGMTELVLDTQLAEDQRQCLETARSAAESLLGLVDALLDFEKIEAGKMELDAADFSLRAVVGDALRAVAPRAHQKGLELVWDIDPGVADALVGDAGKLRQVLINLVGNAIKFTAAGEVAVQVASAEPPRSDREVVLRFEVKDTGVGIPPGGQERIFHAFEQADTSTTRRHGGSGLGLTIASRLVALMGGTITLESEVRRGSTFAFTARLGRQPQTPGRTSESPPVRLHGLPVLVVDDNATSRRILEGWVRRWQMDVTAVSDTATALDALERAAAAGRPYPVVLLDAWMPGADVPGLGAAIRGRPELAGTRIILLTSGDHSDDPVGLGGISADARLLKPGPPDELLDAIDRVMARPAGEPTPAFGPAAPSPHPGQLRILVAEDDEFNSRHFVRLLGKAGHRARLATNGREALALLGIGGPGAGGRPGSDFDLLLLDLHMPELDGFQVVGAIRERERSTGGHLPVIALTARSRTEDRDRCREAGMDDYLSKPVRAAELFAAIGRAVPTGPGARSAGAVTASRDELLDPAALLAACGGDPDGLRGLCQDLRTYALARLAELADALRNGDAPRSREAAHKLCGLLSAFSARAGTLVSEVEDHAAAGRLDEARPLTGLLEAMTRDLLAQVEGLTVESLRGRGAAG